MKTIRTPDAKKWQLSRMLPFFIVIILICGLQDVSYAQDVNEVFSIKGVSCKVTDQGRMRADILMTGRIRALKDVENVRITSGSIGPASVQGIHQHLGNFKAGQSKKFSVEGILFKKDVDSNDLTCTIHLAFEQQPLHSLPDPGPISVSELMLTSRGGLHSLPQWIELYNNSDTETVNLRRWQLTIEARDANGTHRHVVVPLEELIIPPHHTALIVTWRGRHSAEIPDSRVYNFFNHHSDEFEQNDHRNMVLGEHGFYLKLADPDGAVSDIVGNLDGRRSTEDAPRWEIPSGTTQDGARTSLFRRYAKDADNSLDGTDANNWRRAANFGRVGNLPALVVSRYWGRPTDIGNPGYKGANALPVALSSFRAVLKDIGVVLRWTTESEIDNAGFYIYRSKTKNGEFTVVTPTMIQGAGTTGQRNDYTWTDTTVKPNTEYYYRLEDVSFAGEREQSTSIRMKGYISASGKLPTLLGNLKKRDY